MITAALALPLILAVVLVLSGIAKLRAPQTVAAGFRDLRVPAALDRAWLRALLPWGELVLAAALLAAPGALAPVAAIVAALLFLAYWVLIRRALSFEEPVSCGCFGEASAEPVSGWTLARNTVLALVALGSLVTVAQRVLVVRRQLVDDVVEQRLRHPDARPQLSHRRCRARRAARRRHHRTARDGAMPGPSAPGRPWPRRSE